MAGKSNCFSNGSSSICESAALAGHLKLQNWPEVARHVKIISGLSAMIRDDAAEILAENGSSAGAAAVAGRLSAEMN